MENNRHLLALFSELTCNGFGSKLPFRLDHGGLFLCECGYADIVIDMKQFYISEGDMVVFFPYVIVQILSKSVDFDGKVLSSDVSFFASIQISDKSSHYLYVKENPCITLHSQEWSRIVLLHDMLLEERGRSIHPFRQELDECLIKMIVYEVAAIFMKRKPIVQQPRSRTEIIFQQFIFSVFSKFLDERGLEYYASEQSITPRYLSTIVKQMSGMTAGEWIVSCTISHIKMKLQENQMSIADISEEMNFPNPSFFSQYFKKYVGVSPKEYRKQQVC